MVRGAARPSVGSLEAPPAAPPALPRGVIVLLGLAGTVVAVAGMRAVADILGLVLLALMLVVTVSPVSGRLRRLGVPAWLAAVATVTTAYLVLIGLGGALVVAMTRLAELLPTYQSEFAALRADLADALQQLGVAGRPIGDLLARVEPGAVAGVVGSLLDGMVNAFSDAVLLLAVVLFMSLDAARFPSRLTAAAAHRPQVVAALRAFARGTRRYLLVSTVFGLVVAVIDTVVLWALDIPLPVLWGLLAFITNYIPNIGFVIGLLPPALLGLLEGGVERMTAVVVLYGVVNFVIQSIIQPKIVGDAVGLSTTVSFLSLVFWAGVLGPLGALLAVPLSLLAKGLLVDIDPGTRWIDPLISPGAPGPASGPLRPPRGDEAAGPAPRRGSAPDGPHGCGAEGGGAAR